MREDEEPEEPRLAGVPLSKQGNPDRRLLYPDEAEHAVLE